MNQRVLADHRLVLGVNQVFDFDDTLFTTPSADEGRVRYTAVTGNPWVHRSWFNVPESLDARLGVSAAPAMPLLRRLHGAPNTLTVLLSAREESTLAPVTALLHDEGLSVDRVCLRPAMSSDSDAFKVDALQQLRRDFPTVTRIRGE